MVASAMPGTMPAMNSLPTETLVDTANNTIGIDGGMRMPSEPDVVMTPAPKRFGNPCATIAGKTTEPIATTVAGEEPEIAANNAQATTEASARPPYQWPTIAVANAIMRRATPPWVRKLPARMKNGIAMISKLSMPVNSFRATDSVRTSVSVNMKLSTVSPSAIEIGMPVSISDSSRRENDHDPQALRQHDQSAGMGETNRHDQDRQQDERSSPAGSFSPFAVSRRSDPGRMQRIDIGIDIDAVDLGGIVMRQLAGPVERPGNLEKAETHQSRTERDRQIDDPHRRFEIVGLLAGLPHLANEGGAEARDDAGKQCPTQQAERNHATAGGRGQGVDQHVDADMDAGAHAVGCAELGHPDEHVDAKLLRPRQVAGGKPKEDGFQERRQQA